MSSLTHLSGTALAVSQCQRLLGLRDDGIWGPKSKRMFSLSEQKPTIRAILEKHDVRMRSDYSLFRKSVDKEVILEYVASKVDVPMDTLDKLITLESLWNEVAVSPTGYVGLGQLGRAAMSDFFAYGGVTKSHATFSNVKVGNSVHRVLSDFYDPRANALCSAWYLKTMRDSLGNVSWAEAYMAYNLGASNAKRIIGGRVADARALRANPALATNGMQDSYVLKVREIFA